MTEAKHTAGPWTVGTSKKGNVAIIGGFGVVTEVNPAPCNDGVGELDANAHLIAAAPEMLKSLNDIFAFLDKKDGDHLEMTNAKWNTICAHARQAIVKAKGAA